MSDRAPANSDDEHGYHEAACEQDAAGDIPEQPTSDSTQPIGHVLTHDAKHRYVCSCGSPECADKIFSSVTTILGQSVPKDFGVAAWYGQTVGVQGVLRLMARGIGVKGKDPADVVKLLTREKLTVNHTKQNAADRGTAVHQALEDYGNHGTIPRVADFPESDRGYVRGLAKFIATYRPEFVASEVRVLSVEHSFAGTFDFEAYIKAETYKLDDGQLRLRPSNTSRLFTLGDLKTSKWVYPASHFAQLEGYEGARLEMGKGPTDVRAVLWITAEGHMELVPSTATFEDFLTLRRSAEVLQRLEKSYRRPRKASASKPKGTK